MNLYVSNLSFHATDSSLKELFEKYGPVSSAKIIMDRETGRSRGFGFVEMPGEKEAKMAMDTLHNKEIEGRNMSVTVAKEKRTENKRW